MLHTPDFAIEALENRLEQFCITVPYVGTCYKHVWFFTLAYPCWKYARYCF